MKGGVAVENMSDRIKLVRAETGESLRAFGDKIGISDSAVARLESGKNNPSEQTIRYICDKFHVNREWLETGKGPMHATVNDDDFSVINETMNLGKENKTRLFRIIADMPDPLLDAMIEYLKSKLKDLP